MFTVSETVSIARPAGEVFDFLTDGRNRPRWDTSVVSEELTSPPPVGAGSTIHTRMRIVGQEVDIHWRVMDLTRPNRMSLVSTSGPMPLSVSLDFVDIGAACDVRATVEGSPAGMMSFVEPLIAESVSSSFAEALARAKVLLEG